MEMSFQQHIPEKLMRHDREIIDTAVELIDGCFQEDTIVNALHEALVGFMGEGAEVDVFEDFYDENFAMGYVAPYKDFLVFEHLTGKRIPAEEIEVSLLQLYKLD